MNAIAPLGHLYTFEYHEQRAAMAKQEFEVHQMSPWTTVQCRDVCQDGFGLTDVADAGKCFALNDGHCMTYRLYFSIS